MLYYDNSKREKDLSRYDVVITTYGIVSSEYSSAKKTEDKPLFSHFWKRVVLDEAHYIKGRII